MAITVKAITLWRREIDNKPGVLAQLLDPFADSDIDLKVLMAYRYTGNEAKGAVELYPVSGKKAVAAARSAGLSPAGIPAMLVEGANKPGIGYSTSRAIADAGINLAFLVAQVMGSRFTAVYGFDTESDCRRAVSVLRKPPRKR